MNTFHLHATIKKINRRKLIMPGIFLIFCIFMLYVTNLYDLFSLPDVTNPAQAATESHNGTSYVNARLSNPPHEHPFPKSFKLLIKFMDCSTEASNTKLIRLVCPLCCFSIISLCGFDFNPV